MTDDTQECREAFEKWYNSNPQNPLRINDAGFYCNTFTQVRWEAWQAAYGTRANLDAEKLRDIIKHISVAHSMSHTEWCDSSYWKDEHERLVTILDALIKDVEEK